MKSGLIALMTLVVLHSPVAAQDRAADRRSHFGVISTVALPSDFRETFDFVFDAERVDASSQDFEIGFIARGRHTGGDWGVSYVQKSYRDGSVLDSVFNACYDSGCFDIGRLDILRQVRLRISASYLFGAR